MFSGQPEFSANFLYKLMKGSEEHALTDEQVAAVEADPGGTALVIAGAGSGKTELMAVRVLWLVANRYAESHEILGLTFTRKAAGELTRRIVGALEKVAATESLGLTLQALPTVSTYNAYANRIFSDHSLALGYREPPTLANRARVLQLAHQMVAELSPQEISQLRTLGAKSTTLAATIYEMAKQMTEHRASGSAVASYFEAQADALEALPRKKDGSRTKTVTDQISDMRLGAKFARLSDRLIQLKKQSQLVEYVDQVAQATEVVELFPEIARAEAEKFKVIVLDEYQDTSIVQLSLLSTLFAGHSVYAVGDPQQSIYGWRGASSDNITGFESYFGAFTAAPLTKTWRNPVSVLEAANSVIADHPELTQGLPAALRSRGLNARDGAPEGRVEVKYLEDFSEECNRIADFFITSRANHPADGGQPSFAVLLRQKKFAAELAEALRARGLECHILGLSGLLEEPEIVDLIAGLEVLADPEAGSSLIRLLAGPRWRIAASELRWLRGYAKRFGRQAVSDEVDEEQSGEGIADRSTFASVTLLEALDSLLQAKADDFRGLSETGQSRLLDAAKTFRRLRYLNDLPLLELIRQVERDLLIDIEVIANSSGRNPRGNLESFYAEVANYLNGADDQSVTGLMRWIRASEDDRGFELPSVRVEPGVVQILTIHTAKGLEWDYVAVPSLSEGSFPGGGRNTVTWLSPGQLPYALRGDAVAHTAKSFLDASAPEDVAKLEREIKEATKHKEFLEQVRLFYVALTRAKRHLLLTGCYWQPNAPGAKPPSSFLESLLKRFPNLAGGGDELAIGHLPEQQSETNPLLSGSQAVSWPLRVASPERVAKHTEAARLVEQALSSSIAVSNHLPPDGSLGQILANVDLLLDEAAIRRESSALAIAPKQFAASSFKEFLGDPEKAALARLRPIPQVPHQATALGTRFHSWVESRFERPAPTGTSASFAAQDPDSADSLEGDLTGSESLEVAAESELLDDEALTLLGERFSGSRFSKMTPVAIEEELYLVLDDIIVVCKPDAVFSWGGEPAEAASRDAELAEFEPYEAEQPLAEQAAAGASGFEIVDWKTGVPPEGEAELADRFVQLELYRIAYARLKGIDFAKIKITLCYVNATGVQEFSRTDPATAHALLEKWRGVREKFFKRD